MDKKISINMEDGLVTTIEVDGIEYAAPEEILDPQDRARVTEMVSRMMDDPFAEDLEADFEEKFQEVQRKSARFPVLFVSVFLLIAVIMLSIAFFSTLQAIRTIRNEKAADGQIVEVIERQSNYVENGQRQVYSFPVVEFSLPDGQSQRVELKDGTWPPAYKAGQPATILYDPQHPENARIKSPTGALLLWLLPGITGTIGLVFLLIVLLVLRMQKKDERPAPNLAPASS